jgi:SAM-dependent methyltransferase
VLQVLRDQINWEEIFGRATHGHLPPVGDSLRASLEEGQEFFDHKITFAGSDVLDVGCGNGRQMIGLLDQQLNRYVGIDPVQESIDFCNAELVPLVSNAEFVFLDVYNEMYNPTGVMQPESAVLPFADETFDGVITGSVFTHLGTVPVSERYISEIARVLRPGGRFFSSWFRNPPNQLSDDRVRTVFREGEILRMLTKHFELSDTRGGFMGEFHDQWCVFAQKR